MKEYSLEPIEFRPILKRLIWGGRKLGRVLGKPIGAESDYAESWEIADRLDDVSVVASGRFAGTSLRELVRTRGDELLGAAIGPKEQFPLLVKYLDAERVLSVQVHPDDELGARLAGDNGKSEAWFVLQADPEALIYAGLKPGVDRSTFQRAIESGTVEPLLHRFHPEPGDCVMIHAGTVHAIGGGVLLAEIQQMSDATFRVYDWGRVGPNGEPRALHVEQALEATDFQIGPVDPLRTPVQAFESGTYQDLAECKYFKIKRYRIDRRCAIGSSDRFTIVLGVSGEGEIESSTGSRLSVAAGRTILIPAAAGENLVKPLGTVEFLTCVAP